MSTDAVMLTMTVNGGIELDALGGAIQRVAPDDTAFAPRNARFLCFYEANWQRQDGPEAAADNQHWLRDLQKALRPYVSGASYVNFVDPDRGDFLQAYYGHNLARLQAVKKAYDADDFFHFEQSIPLPP